MKSHKKSLLKNGAQLLVECLKKHGVKYIFGIPGAAVMPIMEALRTESHKKDAPQFITCRHEQNAAFMAAAWGRITETPGVCIATAGPGATNLLSGVATATADRDPVIAITGETPRAEHFKKTHQTIRTATLFRPITKWSEEIQDVSAIPEAISTGFRMATLPRQGAVHLTFPLDVLNSKTSQKTFEPKPFSFGKASEETLLQTLELLASANYPVILLGVGATRYRICKSVRHFLEKTQIPVIGTFEAAGAVSRLLANLFIGRVGLKTKEPGDIALLHADLILTIGFDPIEYNPSYWHTTSAPIIHIDELPADPDNYYQPTVEALGDIAYTLDSLSERIPRTYSFHPQAKKAQRILFKKPNSQHTSTVQPLDFIHQLRTVLDDSVTVISDVGSHQVWLAKHFFSYEPKTLLFSMGFQTMGVSLPWAIAAALARPGKKIVSLSGDGSFLMSAMELETAVRLALPIVHIVWRDESYNLVKIQQQDIYKKEFGVSFGNPDIVQFAKSFGAASFRITKPSQIKSVLRKALSLKKPCVIDVPIDYRKNLSLLRPGELLSLS